MRIVLMLSMVLVTMNAMAQSTSLTFDDALSLGIERNPAVVASDYARRAAHRERQAAIGLFMPKISVKGAYAHFNRDIKIDLNHLKTGFSGVLAPIIPSIENALSPLLGLDLSYTLQRRNTAFLGGDIIVPIFAGGKIWIANRAAKINEERSVEQLRQTRGALIVEMVERYFGVELAKAGVTIRQEVVNVVEQHLRDVVLLEREGMAVESERLYAEYRLAEAERDMRRAKLQLATAQQALQTSLGAKSVVEPSTPMFLLPNIESLEYFQTMASLHNPQLEEVGKVRELARMNLRLHNAALYPEVVAMGGMVFCNHQLSPIVPRMAVGIGVNFNIFDGLNREYKISSSRLQLRRVEALERKAEQDISLQIESLYNTLQSILATVGAVKRSERFAEEFLRAKRNAFREGMATATDVIDAALNLSRARLEYRQTAYEFDVALARLLEASGMGELFLQYLHSNSSQSVF